MAAGIKVCGFWIHCLYLPKVAIAIHSINSFDLRYEDTTYTDVVMGDTNTILSTLRKHLI